MTHERTVHSATTRLHSAQLFVTTVRVLETTCEDPGPNCVAVNVAICRTDADEPFIVRKMEPLQLRPGDTFRIVVRRSSPRRSKRRRNLQETFVGALDLP